VAVGALWLWARSKPSQVDTSYQPSNQSTVNIPPTTEKKTSQKDHIKEHIKEQHINFPTIPLN
jgi:hypothetical protein